MKPAPFSTRLPQTHDPVRQAVGLLNAGRWLEAEALLIQCAESPGWDAATRCQLATIALEIEKPHLARGLLHLALQTAPRSPDVQFLAGMAERALGHLSEAIAHLQLAQPESYPDAAYNLSLIHESLGQFRKAERWIQLALKLEPQDADYLNQAACIAARLGQFDHALRLSAQACRAEPDSPGLAFNHAQNLLLTGQAEQGWPLFEARLAFTPEHLFPKNGAIPWEGQPLAGKSLLVWHEQGMGDTLQFSRYLPLIAKVARQVIFRCQPELTDLLSPLLPEVQVVPAGVPEPPTDYHLPLLSLPGRLGCNLRQPPPPLFSAGKNRKPIENIGFVTAGNPNHPDDANRTIPLTEFSPLWNLNYNWLYLQKDLRPKDSLPSHITHLGKNLNHWSQTAEVLREIDLVISVDTAVAHLAASLGKPTWILLPLCPDWRWGIRETLTAWYPSARLFRQTAPGDWSSVIQAVLNTLRIKNSPEPPAAQAAED